MLLSETAFPRLMPQLTTLVYRQPLMFRLAGDGFLCSYQPNLSRGLVLSQHDVLLSLCKPSQGGLAGLDKVKVTPRKFRRFYRRQMEMEDEARSIFAQISVKFRFHEKWSTIKLLFIQQCIFSPISAQNILWLYLWYKLKFIFIIHIESSLCKKRYNKFYHLRIFFRELL